MYCMCMHAHARTRMLRIRMICSHCLFPSPTLSSCVRRWFTYAAITVAPRVPQDSASARRMRRPTARARRLIRRCALLLVPALSTPPVPHTPGLARSVGGSTPSRVLRIGLLFFSLVMSNTYVANLAAFLSQPNFAVHGPTSMAELSRSIVCLPNPDDLRRMTGFANSFVVPDLSSASDASGARSGRRSRYSSLSAADMIAECAKALRDQRADVLVRHSNPLSLLFRNRRTDFESFLPVIVLCCDARWHHAQCWCPTPSANAAERARRDATSLTILRGRATSSSARPDVSTRRETNLGNGEGFGEKFMLGPC